MPEKLILYHNVLFFLIFFCNIILYINGQEYQPQSRVCQGCTLIQSKIYCYGGFTEHNLGRLGPYFTTPLNEHIMLDLQSLGTDLSQLNQSAIQWQLVSNKYNGNNLTSLGQPSTIKLNDDSYIMYGGAATSTINNPNLTYPFLHYNPLNNIWNQLPLMPNNTYSTLTEMVNLGNDSIWVWGGTLNSTGENYTYDYGLFNYNTKSWSNMQINTKTVRFGHTATLANNGIIYSMGGDFKGNPEAEIINSEFKMVFTYDTKKLIWDIIYATGQIPTNRALHTTTLTADGKYLLVYGGTLLLYTGLLASKDVFFIFDISTNSFTQVLLPKNELSPNNINARFGHFAALYNSTYLILSFGFRDASVPAESLSILNISDPKYPVWATGLTKSSTPNTETVSNILIPAIIVPVGIALLGVSVGLFLYRRYRKRKQKKAFVLEQEDPRKKDANAISNKDDTYSIGKADYNSLSSRKSADLTKPAITEGSDHLCTTVSEKSHQTYTAVNNFQKPQQDWPTELEATALSLITPFDFDHDWETKVELSNTKNVILSDTEITKPFDSST